jgi:hypothetical protein
VPEFADDEPPSWRDRLPRIPLFADADTLSKTEAKKARDALIASITEYARFVDEVIPMLSRTHAEAVIWSDLNDKEAAALADFLLAQGMRWAPVAVVVRGTVQTYSWLEVGLITVPRFRHMIAYYLTNGFVLSFRFRTAHAS